MTSDSNSLVIIEGTEVKDLSLLENNFGSAEILIKNNSNCKINLRDLNAVKALNIFVSKNATLKINYIADDSKHDIAIRAQLDDSASLEINYVDFGRSDNKVKANIILLGKNSKAEWSTSCLTNSKYNKKYNISFDHIGEETESNMNNYGVCAGESSLTFDGISHIEQCATKSIAHQIAKVIIYDKECRAKADPILKIDNEDITASHGAAVGTLNDMHMFYLLSRGIEEKEARNLITYGYLKPIFERFSKEENDYLSTLLGEKI